MSAHSLHILLVEDDPTDARLLQEALDAAGHTASRLTVASSLREALPLVEAQDFDVVLLALTLPDSKGLETLEYAGDYARRLPIIILTETETEELGRKAVSAGAQDYLVKGRYTGELVARSLRYAIERHQMQEELRALSLRDELTGLCNQRGFLTLAEQHLKIAARTKADLLILCVDLDHMRQINGTFGHAEGDNALKTVATLLRKTFRHSDIIARLKGHQFAVAVLDMPAGNTLVMTSRLRRNLETYNRGKTHAYTLSLSIGVARLEAGKTLALDDLVMQADAAMQAYRDARLAA
ncbi:MAG TPA: diguanylate cyclase [Chthonomonadaceae bacterium]|nr:diguanylate cyclase [Chthonomonadaceae bacterium]